MTSPETGSEFPDDLDCLRLSWYLPERFRHEGAFLTDRLVGMLAHEQVAAGAVLRGIAGFGVQSVLRTDASLSLSEDPPVTVIAVDRRAVIERLISSTVDLPEAGIVSLERASMPADLGWTGRTGGTCKLTVHLGRHQRVGGKPAFIAVCELLRNVGLAGAATFLAVDGTARGVRWRAKFFHHNNSVPVMVEAVGRHEQVVAGLSGLRTLIADPLVTVERALLCKVDGTWQDESAHGGTVLPEPPTPAGRAAHWRKLTVYTDLDARHAGQPVHRALISELMHSGIAVGATVFRGIWGYLGAGRPRGDRLLQLGRRVPVATVVLCRAAELVTVWPVVDAMTTEHGLVLLEGVPTVARTAAHLDPVAD